MINAANGGKYFKGQHVVIDDGAGTPMNVEIVRANSKNTRTNMPLYVVLDTDGESYHITENEIIGFADGRYHE